MSKLIDYGLHKLAASCGCTVEFHNYTTRKRNGWPVESARPYKLIGAAGGVLGSYASPEGVRRALRAMGGR